MNRAGLRTEQRSYGTLADGTAIDEYTLRNSNGLEVRFITYGGAITRIDLPHHSGRPVNVVLGYPNLEGYVAQKNTFFGALIGRFANRIAHGRLTVGGRARQIAANDGPHALHGGVCGFDKAVWKAAPISAAGAAAVELTHISRDGDQGFPGKLSVAVTYTLRDDDALHIAYRATADRETVVNLTNHTYFNLAGEASGDVMEQLLTIDADRYTPVDATLIPTGELAPVAGTPFDFRLPVAIGARLRVPHPQLLFAHGYDHNWILTASPPGTLRRAVRGEDSASGRTVEISTTEPGVQVYTGNFLDGSEVGTGGTAYRQTSGWTAETQHFPDSPNRPHFPSTLLPAGDTYRSETAFTFTTGRMR